MIGGRRRRCRKAPTRPCGHGRRGPERSMVTSRVGCRQPGCEQGKSNTLSHATTRPPTYSPLLFQLPCEYAFIFVRGFQAAVTEAYPGTAVRQQERHTTTDITPKTLTRSRSATPLPFHTRGHGRASDVLIRAPIAFLPPSSRSSRSREPWRPSTLCPPPRG